MTQIIDTYVSQAKSTTKYSTAPTLQVSAISSKLEYALLQVTGNPVGADQIVATAPLNVYAKGTWASTSLVCEMVTSSWSPSSVTYASMPTVTTIGAITQTHTATDGTVFTFDITAFAQAWATGTSNYGVRIRSTSTTTMTELYSSDATGAAAAFRPNLVITSSTAPGVPTNLNPSNNQQVSIANPTLGWTPDSRYVQTAYQLQTNATNVWTSPTFDSGVVTSSLPNHTLAATVTNGSTLWWRVQTFSNGRVSGYTAGQQFGRTNKSSLSITTPAAPSSNIVTELTPPFAWSFGGTQLAYQIFDTTETDLNTVIWDSLYTPGAATGYTSSVPFAVNGAGDSRATLRVWDSVNRANTPGDPPWTETTRTFHYTPSAGVSPFTTLVAAQASPQPGVTLTFARSSVPDFMQIVRTDTVSGKTKTWADLNPLDFDTSSTTYSWSDMTLARGHAYSYRVDAVVNGIASSASPTVPVTITGGYVWLLDPTDPTWFIPIADVDAGSWGMGEESDVHEIRGATYVILINQALRGYEGSFSGGLYTGATGLGSLTATQLRDRVWTIKQNPVKTYRMVVGDMNFPVVLRNVSVAPDPNKETLFHLSYEFYQVGELPWLA